MRSCLALTLSTPLDRKRPPAGSMSHHTPSMFAVRKYPVVDRRGWASPPQRVRDGFDNLLDVMQGRRCSFDWGIEPIAGMFIDESQDVCLIAAHCHSR